MHRKPGIPRDREGEDMAIKLSTAPCGCPPQASIRGHSPKACPSKPSNKHATAPLSLSAQQRNYQGPQYNKLQGMQQQQPTADRPSPDLKPQKVRLGSLCKEGTLLCSKVPDCQLMASAANRSQLSVPGEGHAFTSLGRIPASKLLPISS